MFFPILSNQLLVTLDGSILATGGRGKVLYLFSSETYEPIVEPIHLDGRIWGIDFSPPELPPPGTASDKDVVNAKSAHNSNLAVASGSDVAIIFDAKFQPCLQVHRPRTARCLKYHPNLPILAIGDGSGQVAIVDYENEETIKEFCAGSRVNTVDFSPRGDFLVVGTDECLFTMYETTVRIFRSRHTPGTPSSCFPPKMPLNQIIFCFNINRRIK